MSKYELLTIILATFSFLLSFVSLIKQHLQQKKFNKIQLESSQVESFITIVRGKEKYRCRLFCLNGTRMGEYYTDLDTKKNITLDGDKYFIRKIKLINVIKSQGFKIKS